MGPASATHWGHLSLELWINILSRLEENFAPRDVWNQRDCLESYAEMHSNMHKLRLVCSKFRAALDDAQLSRCLFVREGFQNRHLPTLLRWADHQRTSVQLFACNVGSPALEATLATLACTESQLRFACIPECSQSAVDILSSYSALHSIDLGSGSDRPLVVSLQPLAALPSLGKLVLAIGTFQGFETLPHLTNLKLSGARVMSTAACICASKLVKLKLVDSTLSLPGQGLAACHALRDLILRRCLIGASRSEDHVSLMADMVAHVPDGVSALTHLTSLDVTLCGDSLDEMELSWLASMTALQELGFHVQEELELPAELTELTSLTRLWLSTADSEDETACVDFQVKWRDMHALDSLFIDAGLYAFDSQLLQLADCTALKTISFDKVRPDSAESAKFLAALTYILAVKRPDVVCYLDQVRVTDMLEEV